MHSCILIADTLRRPAGPLSGAAERGKELRMVFRQIQVGPIGTNCYLLGEEKSGVCFVADPGDEPERVLRMVGDAGLALRGVLLTHGHYDHTGGVAGMLERYPDIPVYIHKNDLLVPGGSPRYQFAGAGENQRTYGEGDVLPLGESSLQVLHTPGHSPGSVVLLWGNVMIAGDTLFAGSCGRCDLLGGSMEEMFASLKRLGSLSGDYQVCPGHGPATTLETERRTNPYVRHALQL